ncbi:MAG TPA: serine/threonine-protein kinase [Phycisphaerae bacterium]|nr:serine/threonine-protein kinase [Phycisphaerae bacterium]
MNDKNFSPMMNDPKAGNAPMGTMMGLDAPTPEDMGDEHDDVAGSATATKAPFAIESIIKDYRIIRTVSETTTSIVYKAEDLRSKRRVAIKVIYNRGVPDFERINRARAEIERLVHLSHPGIATVFDAGLTEEGHCYFVSEFIKGVTLSEYVTIHKLSLEDRLSIFSRLCEAVQYTHQKCLLHRDLRPSNIVIDGRSHPRIVGLGVAGVTDVDVGPAKEGSGKRELREFVAYKSPEQVSGRLYDIDVRSDVYSLGVILYELLTDRLPYNGNSENAKEVVQAVTNEMPAKPSGVKGSLSGDLEAIMLKSLEKQPSDRYQTVLALSQDMENYFAQRPVGARPAGAMYEFRKLATRYKSRSISVAIMTLAVLAFGTHIHMTTRDAGKRMVAEVEHRVANEVAQAKTAQGIAIEEMKAARAALETEKRGQKSVDSRLLEAEKSLANVESMRSELTALVKQAEARGKAWESLAQFWKDSISGRSRSTAESAALGDMLVHALGRASRTFKDMPLERASILNEIGVKLMEVGQAKRAIAPLEDALELRTEKLGATDEHSIDCLNNLASAFFAMGEPAKAEPHCRELVAATTKTFGEDHQRTLTAINNLAMTVYAQKKLPEAEELLIKALTGRTEVLGADDRRTGTTAQNLGMVQYEAGKFQPAFDHFEVALKAFKKKMPAGHWLVGDTTSRMGGCLVALGRFELAEPLLISAHESLKKSLGATHPDTRASFERLIACYRGWGRNDMVEKLMGGPQSAVAAPVAKQK